MAKPRGLSITLLVLVQGLICFAYLGLYWILRTWHYDASSLIYWLSVSISMLALWSFWSWYQSTGEFFDPYTIFLLAAFAFNAGQTFLEIFEANHDGMLAGAFSARALVITLLLVATGLSAFHFGALVAVRSVKRVARPSGLALDGRRHERSILFIGWILLVISLPSWWITSQRAIGTVLSGGYGALYERESVVGISAGLGILAEFLVPALIFLLVGSRPGRLAFTVAIIVLIVHTVVEFFLGYRAYAMWPVLAAAWAYHRAHKRIPTALLTIGGFFVLTFVLPAVGAFRSEAGQARASLSEFLNTYVSIDNPLIGIISEMGGSMMTVAHTVELVPTARDYEYGYGYLLALSTVIPNIFGGVHPAIAHGTATQWLTETINPWTAERGGSYGYSFIAEAYLNGGWIGTPFIMFGVGFLMAKYFRRASGGGNILAISAAAIMLSFLTHYARGEAYTVVRALVWYTGVPIAAVITVTRLTRSRTSSSIVEEQSELMRVDRGSL